MSRVLIVPAVAADRTIARALAAALDRILGYPRAHSRDEAGVAWDARGAARTKTWCGLARHANAGTMALRGRTAIVLDDLPERLAPRVIELDGRRRTLADTIAWLTASVDAGGRGWLLESAVPGQPTTLDATSLWAPMEARDGAPGSEDGRPILPEDDPEPDRANGGGR